jgi:hypothetical protein
MAHPTPNLRWFAIFADHPQAPVKVDEPGDLLARFDMASQLGHIEGRRIKGLWIIRREGESQEVLHISGLVPVDISVRFYDARRHQGQ